MVSKIELNLLIIVILKYYTASKKITPSQKFLSCRTLQYDFFDFEYNTKIIYFKNLLN